MIRYSSYALLFILAAIVLMETNGLFFSEKESAEIAANLTQKTSESVNLLEEGEFWSVRIDEAGAALAYEEFKNALKPYDFKIQHVAVHVFGEVLYESEGIAGVVICDSTFSFGCYHSFFLKALSEHGKDVVLDMDRACIEKYGVGGVGCQHGIGHGLVEYLGPDRLVEALDACETLAWKNPLFGCKGGVFMEYTLPTIFDSKNSFISVRDIDQDNPYDACPGLAEKFKQACYYSLGQWWNKFFSYEKIGELCDDVINDKEKEACYLGVGAVVAPSSDFDTDKSIADCQKMPDFEGRLTCRAGASWAFFAMPELRSLSLKLCEGLEIDSEHLCAQKADLVGEGGLRH